VAPDGDEHETTSFRGALGGALKNPAVAVVFIGGVLILVSAFASVPYLGPFTGIGWRQFIAASGVAIVTTGLWKLLRSPRASNEASSANNYGLRIDVPSRGSSVGRKIRVEGSCEKIPPQGSLTIVEKFASTSRYWLKPQTPEFDKKRWWFSDVYVGGSKDDERVLYVAVMGESGRAFKDYFLLVRATFKEPLGTETLPKDISLGPHVSVRQAESDPPKPNGTHLSYGMSIDWPPDHAVVGTKVQLRGSYKNKPLHDSLVIYEKNEDDNEYWFKQEKPEFNESTRKWSAVIYIGAGTSKRILCIALAGEGGKAARNYCKVVYDRVGRWIPLESLPPDIQPLAQMEISYSANEKLQTKPQ